MFKIFKVVLLSIVLTLVFSFSYGAVEKSNIDSIMSYTKSVKEGKYDNFEVYKVINNLLDGTQVKITLLISKENTADHDYFDWKWTIHILKIYNYLAYDAMELEIASKDYQDFVSTRSRGFVQWILIDKDLNGKADIRERRYTIVACEDDECENNYIVIPSYPEGFINKNWYYPSEEESNERYAKEINYWIKTICGGK